MPDIYLRAIISLSTTGGAHWRRGESCHRVRCIIWLAGRPGSSDALRHEQAGAGLDRAARVSILMLQILDFALLEPVLDEGVDLQALLADKAFDSD